MMRARIFAATVACIGLSACSMGGNAIVDTFKSVLPLTDASEPELDPRFQYLRVETDGRVGYLALGATENSDGTSAEVWYSANREVIRLSGGHIAAAVGTNVEWRKASLPNFQSWKSIANSEGFRWMRLRDVMPGYLYGTTDTLVLKAIPQPRQSNWRGPGAELLTWFEETQEASSSREDPLPNVRYAVRIQDRVEQVQYGEVCLSATLCFSWQRWNPKVNSASGQK